MALDRARYLVLFGATSSASNPPDETAPILSNASGSATSDTTADLSVSTNEGNGTLYWVVTQSATPPSAAQVKAGQDDNGDPADASGSQSVVSTGAQNVSGGATGLTAETTYYAHFMHEDAAENQSDVASSSSFETDAEPVSPPVNTVAPAVTGTEEVGETLSCSQGTWDNSPTSFAYQWYQTLLDGSDDPLLDGNGNKLGTEIVGATSSTYELQAGDEGEKIHCDVTATNAGGSALESSNATGFVTSGSGNAAETDAFLARTSGLDATHIAAYEDLINGLVADGVFSLLDILYIFATEDTTTALLNLVQDAFNATETGTPTFTADQGYAGSSGSYISSGFNPSTAGGNITQNSAMLAVYDRTSRTDLDGFLAIRCTDGSNFLHLGPRYNRASGGMWACLNDNTAGIVYTNANAQGMLVATRTGAAAGEGYKNEASLGNDTAASTGLPNATLTVCGGASGDGNDQIAAAAVGAALDDTQAAALSSRINAYMIAVGANVY